MASRTPPTSAERMTLQFMEDSYVKLTKAGGQSAGLAAILMIGFGEKNSRARRIGEGSLNHQLDMSTKSGSYDQAGMTARVVLVSGQTLRDHCTGKPVRCCGMSTLASINLDGTQPTRWM